MLTSNEIAFLALTVGALLLFGGVLGWASFEEYRRKRNSR